MNNTITLTEKQMKALQEGKPITIEPPKKEPGKFQCREDNKYYPNLDGTIRNKGYNAPSELENYAFLGTVEEAREFEQLRKQIAIRFEFLKQHAPLYKPTWDDYEDPKYYVYYDAAEQSWDFHHQYQHISPIPYMPKEVARKFCSMANAGLIEGLERPLFN